jgi:hypothetical protein
MTVTRPRAGWVLRPNSKPTAARRELKVVLLFMMISLAGYIANNYSHFG